MSNLWRVRNFIDDVDLTIRLENLFKVILSNPA